MKLSFYRNFIAGRVSKTLGVFVVLLTALALVSSPVGVQWLLLTYLLHTFGELTLSPVGL